MTWGPLRSTPYGVPSMLVALGNAIHDIINDHPPINPPAGVGVGSPGSKVCSPKIATVTRIAQPYSPII